MVARRRLLLSRRRAPGAGRPRRIGPPRVPEKVEQAHGVNLLGALSAYVYVIGTRRPKGDYQGTRQTPGIPDVYAVLPPPILNPSQTSAVALWWECKAKDGQMSKEQRTFEINSRRAGVAHVVGTFDDLIRWLVAGGWMKPENVAWYRREPPRAVDAHLVTKAS